MPSDESGFSLHPHVLSALECDRLTSALDTPSLSRLRAGARHLMANSDVRGLASDSRLLAIARAAVGVGAAPFRATLFEKSADTNWLIPWHQDTALPLAALFSGPGWGPWSRKADIDYAHAPAWALSRVVALRVHLDESGRQNGPLRVIPGSHAEGVLSDEQVAAAVRERAAAECVVPRGGVLAMRPLLIHSSSKVLTSAPRRVLHIEYADALELAPGIRLAVV